MKVTVLGSGTSTGVPTVGCQCPTCTSADVRDKRLRTSIWIEIEGTNIIVDTSSDFRQQCIRAKIPHVDAIVYTHHHFDHIAGFDDLRGYNFTQRRRIPIYAMAETLHHLYTIFDYAFSTARNEASRPLVDVTQIDDAVFEIAGHAITPIPLYHGSMRVNGYRLGSFAYCTDCNRIPETSFELLNDLDVLILDGLRLTPHPTHFTIEQAVDTAKRIGAGRTYLTHIAHEIRHAEIAEHLPDGVELAYDGLTINLADTDR